MASCCVPQNAARKSRSIWRYLCQLWQVAPSVCFSLSLSLSVFLSLSAEKPIMRMLDARLGDREAQEFVRRLKEIEKSMEEE